MAALISFLPLNRPCDEAVDWLRQSLSHKGLRVLQTFDLQTARFSLESCSCPSHGINQCDCQMIVLLVYGNAEEPVTLMLHGNGGQTWLSIVNNSLQHAHPSTQSSIEQALQLNSWDRALR
jgi:hypothetical protein